MSLYTEIRPSTDLEFFLLQELRHKEQSQRHLRNLNDQLTNLIKNSETKDCQALLGRIKAMETSHFTQLRERDQVIAKLKSEQSSQFGRLQNQKQEAYINLENARTQIFHLAKKVSQLQATLKLCENSLNRYKEMSCNQESLLDDYRVTVEEQVAMEHEFIAVSMQAKEHQLKTNFTSALKQIQQNYKKKLRKAKKQKNHQKFQNQLQNLKSYIQQRKSILQGKENYSKYSTKID